MQTRGHLQTQTRAWREQQTLERAQAEKARLRSAWMQRAQAWQGQRQRLAQLHAAFDALAPETGLRVERWQGDGRKLLLQARLPGVSSVPAVLSGLSGAWGPGWTLHSLGDRADGGVDVVLQAPWPADAVEPAPSK